MVAHACDPSTGKVEKEELRISGTLASQHRLIGKVQTIERYYIKKTPPKEWRERLTSGLYSLLYTNVHSDIHMTTVQLREEPTLSLLEGCSSGIMISSISDLPPEVLGLEKS